MKYIFTSIACLAFTVINSSFTDKAALNEPTGYCSINVESVQALNGLGSNEVVFYTVHNNSSGTTITSSWFLVFFESGHSQYYFGSEAFNGYQRAFVPVDCNNRITKVTVTLYASNSGTDCSDTITKNYSYPLCGTGEFG